MAGFQLIIYGRFWVFTEEISWENVENTIRSAPADGNLDTLRGVMDTFRTLDGALRTPARRSGALIDRGVTVATVRGAPISTR